MSDSAAFGRPWCGGEGALRAVLGHPWCGLSVRPHQLRAVVRIGELSAGLEKAKPLNGKGAGIPTGGKSKAAILKTAGISTSAANRAHAAAR